MIKTKSVIRVSMVLMAAFLVLFAMNACVPTNTGCDENDVYGPYDTTQDMNSGAGGRSGVFYPSNIASESGTFPVLVFGCGAGSGPINYVDHGNIIASNGFIVIITASDNGGRMNTNAINWIIQQNNSSRSKFYGKVNTDKIAAGGHSMGSIGTFAMADDPRLTTTIHVAGGSFDGNGYRKLRNPVIYISGTTDMARSNCVRDYNRTVEKTDIPVFFTIQQGVDHIMCAREGLPAIIDWMKWHLKGETQLSAEFIQQGGKYTVGKWNSEWDNW